MSIPGPAQRVQIDLNGDGTLVDVTDFVDWDVGITYQWGRSDWSASEIRPGLVNLRLDNIDGRFTPGNTTTYSPGLSIGMRATWTAAGTRTKYLTVTDISPRFAADGFASSVVDVEMSDLLGMLARRTMRSMLDELYLVNKPLGYWRLDESGSANVQCRDTSGNGGPSISAISSEADISWAGGGGPPSDPGGGVYFGSGRDELSADGPSIATRGTITNPDPALGVTLRFFFTAPLMPLAPDDTISVMHLATLFADDKPIVLYLDAYGGLDVGYDGAGYLGPTVGSLSATHFVALSIWRNSPSDNAMQMALTVDSDRRILGSVPVADFGHLRLVFGETPAESLDLLQSFLIFLGQQSTAAYAHTGAISRVGLFAGGDVTFDSIGQVPVDFYATARSGPSESVPDRVQRILLFAYPIVAFAESTFRGDTLGVQATSGSSALSAMSEALAQDGMSIAQTSEVDVTVYPYGVQRPATPALTVDIDADCQGAPDVSFDRSAIASVVSVESESTTAYWVSPDATGHDLTTTVRSAQLSYVDALNLAQYRAIRGRIGRPFPASITCDLTRPGTIGALSLYAGQRVRTTGWDEPVMGYSEIDGYVSGGDERYDSSGATARLYLEPTDLTSPAWELYDGTAVSDVGRLQADARNVLMQDCTADATGLFVADDATSPFAVSDQIVIAVGDEHMRVTGQTQQQIFVVRGVDGTTATSHVAGDRVTVVGVGYLAY